MYDCSVLSDTLAGKSAASGDYTGSFFTMVTFPGMFPFQVVYSQYQSSQGFFLSELITQFTRQVLRPRVLLCMLAATVILFDLDDLFDLEGIEFEEEEDPHQEPDNDPASND